MSKKGEQIFHHIKQIAGAFQGDEQRVATIYVSTLTSKKQKVNEVASLMFKEIQKKRSSYTLIAKKIDLARVSISLDFLLEKVLVQVRESLLLKANTRKKGHYSELYKVKFELKKRLLEAYLLYAKDIVIQSAEIVEAVIKSAKKFELYGIINEALWQKMILTANINTEDYRKTMKEIQHYRKCLILFYEANELYHSCYAERLDKVNAVQLYQSQSKLERILQIAEEISSVNVWCYYYLLKIEINNYQINPHLSIEYISKLIVILEGSPAVYSKARIKHMYQRKGEIEFGSLQFISSLESHNKSNSLYSNYFGFSRLLNELSIIKPFILISKLDEAIAIIHSIKGRELNSQYPIQFSECIYKEMIVHFLMGKYEMAYALFSEKLNIERDKEGWNVWIRIMRILCLIELNKLESIDYDIENFRKYLERTGKEYEVEERDQLILKVLIELNRQSFDYQKTAAKRKEELKKLSSTDRRYAWNPNSAELMLFHEWFWAKLTGKTYKVDFDVYRKAWYPEIDYTNQDDLFVEA